MSRSSTQSTSLVCSRAGTTGELDRFDVGAGDVGAGSTWWRWWPAAAGQLLTRAEDHAATANSTTATRISTTR